MNLKNPDFGKSQKKKKKERRAACWQLMRRAERFGSDGLSASSGRGFRCVSLAVPDRAQNLSPIPRPRPTCRPGTAPEQFRAVGVCRCVAVIWAALLFLLLHQSITLALLHGIEPHTRQGAPRPPHLQTPPTLSSKLGVYRRGSSWRPRR
jgi:hypothetical protein